MKYTRYYSWWFRNPAPVEVGSLSHYLQGFIHVRCLFGISAINSLIDKTQSWLLIVYTHIHIPRLFPYKFSLKSPHLNFQWPFGAFFFVDHFCFFLSSNPQKGKSPTDDDDDDDDDDSWSHDSRVRWFVFFVIPNLWKNHHLPKGPLKKSHGNRSRSPMMWSFLLAQVSF